MATPITWQNINAPDLGSVGRGFESAQRSFGSAFDQLGAMLSQRENTEEKNWQNTRTNNTNAFLDQLAGYRTPEELAAAQQSGALQTLRQRFGSQIDSTAIRGAEEQRINALRTGAKQAGEFEDFSKERAQRIIVDDIRQTMLTNPELAKQMLKENGNLFKGTELARELDGREQELVGRGRDTIKFTRDGESHVAKLANDKRQLALEAERNAISRSSVAVQREGVGLQREESRARQEAALSKQLTDAIEARSKMKDAGINTPEAMKQVTDYINTNYKDENTRADLLAKATAAMQNNYIGPDGKKIPVNPAAVMQAIGATKDTRWMKWIHQVFNDSDQGDYIQENLVNILKTSQYRDGVDTREKSTNAMTSQIQRLEDRLNYGSKDNLDKLKGKK